MKAHVWNRARQSNVKRPEALQWIAATGAAVILGSGMPARASKPIRIGALVPVTGDVDAYAGQMRIRIETAISEINRAGGVLGRPLAVEYRDSETTPAVLPDRCRELIDDWGAIALIGPWATAGQKYAARFLADRHIPLINATNHEGAFCHPALFSVGPTTSHDGHALVRYLDESEESKDYFMLGSYPSWQNTMFRQLRFRPYQRGGSARYLREPREPHPDA